MYLRKFRMEDANEAYEDWKSNKITLECFNFNKHRNIEETKRIILSLIAEFESGEPVWALESKKTGKIIGCVKVIIENNRICYMQSFVIRDEYKNRGYLEEALEKIINFIIIEKNYYMITSSFFDVDKQLTEFNEKVLEKVKMKKEAVLRNRKENIETGKLENKIIYSVIKEDLQ